MNRTYKKTTGLILALTMAAGLLLACGADTKADAAEGAESRISGTETEAVKLPGAGAAAGGDDRTKEVAGSGQESGMADQETADADGEDENGSVSADILSDPTLGGIFELYTPEEYEAEIEMIKKYADGGGDAVKNMEEDLEKLKADGGRGEFVIYKSVFDETYEENGAYIKSGFNPVIVMDPQRGYRSAPEKLTAENYRKDIESVAKTLDEAIGKGMLTLQQKEVILAKMNENLAALE